MQISKKKSKFINNSLITTETFWFLKNINLSIYLNHVSPPHPPKKCSFVYLEKKNKMINYFGEFLPFVEIKLVKIKNEHA